MAQVAVDYGTGPGTTGAGYTQQQPVGTQSGGGGGGGASTSGPAAADWRMYIQDYGFPPEIVAKLSEIFQNNPDREVAAFEAMKYIRTTPWYAQTYPGIQEAIKLGVVANEADYRSRFNNFNQIYRQYNGKDLSPADFAAALKEGVSADVYAKRFQGAANVQAYGGDWRYLSGAFGQGQLSAADQKTLGEQTAGIQTTQGTVLEKLLQDAQKRMERAFSGVLAGPTFQRGSAGNILAGGGAPADIGR